VTILIIKKLKDLKATNPYLRLNTDVSDLEKSIQTVGLIAPLVISSNNVILAGARRYQALLNLGFKEAPVVVIDLGPLEIELVSIDENLIRKDLTKIEIEGHLRRAKEIYQGLNPDDLEITQEETLDNKNILPSEKFLTLVSDKTGLSPKQIYEAINRDEQASANVKEARKKGDLSLSQTNEIIKLPKGEQQKSLSHIKNMPVREIKNFVKIAKAIGVDAAINETQQDPNQRELVEIELSLKKLLKKFKQLELEGITLNDLPLQTQKLFASIMKFADENHTYSNNKNADFVEESLQ
jgi:ParB family chromosome partitioning protein